MPHPLDISIGLYDHYESIEEVKHYFGVLAIYALLQAAELKQDASQIERCRAILQRFPDDVTHPHYNFPSYRIGGIPRAYALYRGHMADDRTRELVREYAQEMMTAARDERGLVCNPHKPEKQIVWIDCAMAVTPYLLFAGLALDEPRYVAEAVRQAELFYAVFLNPDNGLLHQCENAIGPGVMSEDHWGRGQGWGLIALTELVEHLPADAPERSRIDDLFIAHCEALLPHQTRRGLWRQEVPLIESWEESSGAGLILYGFGVGLRHGLLEADRFRPAFERGVRGLARYCVNPDFSTELSCEGCMCPRYGDQHGTVEAYLLAKRSYHDEHHSFAPLMLAMNEAFRNGVSDLEPGHVGRFPPVSVR